MNERYRMLHVEDDKDWQDEIKRHLQDRCQITSCSSIGEVLILLKQERVFDIAVVDLTIDRFGDDWEIKTPEDLILHLKSQGIGVVVFSGVYDKAKPRIESTLGVKIIDKSDIKEVEDFQTILTVAILNSTQPDDET